MTRKIVVGLVAVLGVALVGYLGWATAEGSAYERAVRAQAAAKGLHLDSLEHPAHWPLDYYASRLEHATSPVAAERIVTDADSTRYYRLAVGRTRDSSLVQAFFFRVGPRTGVVQVHYQDCTATAVEGADWLPPAETMTPRAEALRMCTEGSRPGRQTTR